MTSNGPEDLQAGSLGERLLHADGPVLQHRESGEAVAEDHLPVASAPPSSSSTCCAEDAPRLHRSLADVGCVDARAQQVELDDGHAGVDDLVEPVGHRLAGHRDGQAVSAGRHDVLGRGQLGVGVATGRTSDLDGDAEILGGELGRVDDLLDERVADDVGDEADRQVVVRCRSGCRRRVVRGRPRRRAESSGGTVVPAAVPLTAIAAAAATEVSTARCRLVLVITSSVFVAFSVPGHRLSSGGNAVRSPPGIAR